MNDYERQTAELRTSLIIRRKMLALGQRELARRMGTTQAAISDLESGKNPNPTIATITRWATALQATVDLTVTFGEVKIKAYTTRLSLGDTGVTNDLHDPLNPL